VDPLVQKELVAAVSMVKLQQLPLLKGRAGLYGSENEE